LTSASWWWIPGFAADAARCPTSNTPRRRGCQFGRCVGDV